VVTAPWWRSGPVAASVIIAVISTAPVVITVLSVTIFPPVITSIVVGAGTRVIQVNSDSTTTKILAVQILDSAIGVVPRQELEDSLSGDVAINIGEGDISSVSAEIFQVLAADTNDIRVIQPIRGESRENFAWPPGSKKIVPSHVRKTNGYQVKNPVQG
jgi:hypothetical protein